MRPIGPEEALLALQDRQLQQAQLTHQYKCGCQQRACTERRIPMHRSQAVKGGRSGHFEQEQSAASRSPIARSKHLASQRHRTAPAAEIQRRNLLDYIHASPIGSNQSGSRSIGMSGGILGFGVRVRVGSGGGSGSNSILHGLSLDTSEKRQLLESHGAAQRFEFITN